MFCEIFFFFFFLTGFCFVFVRKILVGLIAGLLLLGLITTVDLFWQEAFLASLISSPPLDTSQPQSQLEWRPRCCELWGWEREVNYFWSGLFFTIRFFICHMSFIKIKTGGNWRLLNGRGAGPIFFFLLSWVLAPRQVSISNTNILHKVLKRAKTT